MMHNFTNIALKHETGIKITKTRTRRYCQSAKRALITAEISRMRQSMGLPLKQSINASHSSKAWDPMYYENFAENQRGTKMRGAVDNRHVIEGQRETIQQIPIHLH